MSTTRLEKARPVRRRATLVTDHRRVGRKQDEVVVTVYPNKTIGFRQVRCRTEYLFPIETVYRMAMVASAAESDRKPARRVGKKGE